MTTITSQRSRTVFLVGLLGFVAAACGDGDFDYGHYFATKPYRNSECNRANDGKLALSREVRLFTFGNTDAPPFSRSLQRYYRRHGLSLFSNHPVTQIAQDYILDTDGSALGAGLDREFPGTDLNDEAALKRDPVLYERIVRYTMNFVFRPVIEFARTHGTVGVQVTNLVVVPEILRPGGDSVFGPGAQVLGLAISPALLEVFARQDLAEGGAWKSIDLPKDFTPMMFLDGRVVGALHSAQPEIADLVAAHEFGHTGALVHRETDHNLMLPAVRLGESACTDSLDPDQLDTLRATLEGARPGMALKLEEGAAPEGARTASLQALLPPAELPALLRGDPAAFRKVVARFAH